MHTAGAAAQRSISLPHSDCMRFSGAHKDTVFLQARRYHRPTGLLGNQIFHFHRAGAEKQWRKSGRVRPRYSRSVTSMPRLVTRLPDHGDPSNPHAPFETICAACNALKTAKGKPQMQMDRGTYVCATNQHGTRRVTGRDGGI